MHLNINYSTNEVAVNKSSPKNLSVLDKLDLLRFISANLVIICHLIDQFIARKDGYENPLGIGHLNCWLGIIAVFCFFVLSGYVISFSVANNIKKHGHFDLADYIKKRFFRIYPTALCSVVYMLFIVLVMKEFNLNGLGADGFKLDGDASGVPNYLAGLPLLYSVFLPPSGYFGGFFNVAMWTLSYEFGFYLCFGLLCYLKMNYGVFRSLLIIVFVSCSLFVWHTTNFNLTEVEHQSRLQLVLNFMKIFPSWNFLLFFMIWGLGSVLFFLTQHKKKCKPSVVIFFAAVATGLMYIAHHVFNVPFNYNVYSGMSALSDPTWSPIMTFAYGIWMMLFIYLVTHWGLKANTLHLLSSLGRKYSFTLYVTHYGMINLAFGLFWNSLNTFTLSDHALLFLSLLLLTNVIAYYLSKWFEDRNLWANLFKHRHLHQLTQKDEKLSGSTL